METCKWKTSKNHYLKQHMKLLVKMHSLHHAWMTINNKFLSHINKQIRTSLWYHLTHQKIHHQIISLGQKPLRKRMKDSKKLSNYLNNSKIQLIPIKRINSCYRYKVKCSNKRKTVWNQQHQTKAIKTNLVNHSWTIISWNCQLKIPQSKRIRRVLITVLCINLHSKADKDVALRHSIKTLLRLQNSSLKKQLR